MKKKSPCKSHCGNFSVCEKKLNIVWRSFVKSEDPPGLLDLIRVIGRRSNILVDIQQI